MSIARIGDVVEYTGSGRDQNSGNTGATISVPSNASLVVVAVGGYQATDDYFTTGSLSLTDGALTPLSEVQTDDASLFMLGVFFKTWSTTPTATQTLSWDWVGDSAPVGGARIVYAFYSGTDTAADPRRTYGGQQVADLNAAAATTGALTTSAGDYAIGFASGFSQTSGATFTWTGVSKVADYGTVDRDTVSSWAEGAVSGSVTITAQADQSTTDDGGLGVLIIKPAAVTDIPRSPAAGGATVSGQTAALRYALRRDPTTGTMVWAGLSPEADVFDASTQHAVPLSDIAAGAWTPSTGTDLYAMVNEAQANDADYIRSGAAPVVDTAVLGLEALNPPDVGTVTLRLRARWVT